jgi:hypothetical protein
VLDAEDGKDDDDGDDDDDDDGDEGGCPYATVILHYNFSPRELLLTGPCSTVFLVTELLRNWTHRSINRSY